MLRFTWFETLDELQSLTGLTREQLWDAGFNLDDWDFGIRCNKILHEVPSKSDIEAGEYHEDELIVDYDREGYWLMQHMLNHCVGPDYVKFGRWHYYLVHHA